VWIQERIREFFGAQLGARCPTGLIQGPHGAVAKLLWLHQLRSTTDAISSILGLRLAANHGSNAFDWAHVLGAPGFRISGETKEILKNIISERGLGLPSETKRAAQFDRAKDREKVADSEI